MDIELILYIVFIAIAILTRVLKGKKTTDVPPQQEDHTMDAPQRPTQKQMSFEELLREFTGEEKPHEKTQPRPLKEEVVYESYEDEPSYESDYYADEEAKHTYDRSVREARQLKTIDEIVDLEKPLESGHFKGYEIEEEESIAADIFESLRDTDGAKKAIILSEIINRKY